MEAAEHIRQHDGDFSGEEDACGGKVGLGGRNEQVKSPESSVDPKIKDTEKELAENGERSVRALKGKCPKETSDLIKSESVANLRAKAKEHSAKLMGSLGGAEKDVKEEGEDE